MVLHTDDVKRAARACGFALAGVARAAPLDPAPLRRWLAQGHAADMTWLADRADDRLDPGRVLRGARTVVALAIPHVPPPGETSPVAAYARGRDYHYAHRDRLKALRKRLLELDPALETYACVDTGVTMEKPWAERAGLGFIGKNGLLITPAYGSAVTLSVMFVNRAVDRYDEPAARLCGDCELCLRACPTGAIAEPGVVDARLCIAYHTIENEGVAPAGLRPRLRGHLFGCDVCQDVCPLNRGAAPERDPRLEPRPTGLAPARAIAAMSAEEWKTATAGTSLARAGYDGMRRNAILAMSAPEARGALPLLSRLARDSSAVVADAAGWSLRRLRVLSCWIVLALGLAAGCATPAARSPQVSTLPFGDPALRERRVPVVLDAVTETSTGAGLSPAEVAARLADADVVIVGEEHGSVGAHAAQARIVAALLDAGRAVTIGLEMLPHTVNEPLARYAAGALDEADMLRATGWYRHWGYPFGYYRDVFVLARARGARLVGLNVPRELITALRKQGRDALPADQAALLPPAIDTASDEHRRLFRAYFGAEDKVHAAMPAAMWEGLFAAQCAWDATMAFQAVRALREARQPRPIVVALAGSGHVAFGLGIERQARAWHEGRIATIIPVVVEPGARAATWVRATYADYVIGVPPDPALPPYPTLGLGLRDGEGGVLEVTSVTADGVAARAGVRAGDRLITLAGESVASREDVGLILHRASWGDALDLIVRRGDRDVTLRLALRRKLQEPSTSD